MSNDHEWLNLIEVSGPFLAMPVLRDVFPQGLEALPSGRPQRLRRTYEEWRDAVDMDDIDLQALHAAWIDDVLLTALEMDETVLRKGTGLPERLTVSMPEHGVAVAPDLAVINPTSADEPLLLLHVYHPDTDLDATRRFDGLAITPADRMVTLLRATGCPTGIVTNGERWMLVHAHVGAVAGFASWYARLWGQEPETLRAFVSLLGVRRFFGPDEGKLPALYERSLKHQDDVTEALGEQVRRAVEVLVQALDRADQDRNRELLRDVDPRELYEAGLTVMMRLVFLLAAEERALLLLGDPRYDSFYAISSLRMQLRADTEEILERRRSAWSRLLALFRGVYGGIEHPTLRLPALGGSLFDPDRYPFLEGRKKGTSWRNDAAEPLPIDDRTVLLLLEAIQTFEGRTLSYRALDVEQIGHVYEGLLERTVKRVDDVTLELDSGAKAKSPRVTLGEMESARLDGTARVAELLKERSERSESAIRNALERATDDRLAARLLTVCRGDVGLRDRILPYASLLRTDPWGYPLVHHKGAFVVVLGADRRESGTHYTPKSLTEKIVEETLTPVAYRGPAEGKTREAWELKSAEELLDLKICDPAMGSGAFLVQACRWLSDRLVEAWSATEANGKRIDSEGNIIEDSTAEGFDFLPPGAEERAIVARRIVAERCLYGVDKNPLAVELAKLSLWLTTMSKGRPFGFLDHNLRSGDSLLGIHDLGQLVELDMNPKGKAQLRLFGRTVRSAIDKALELRARLRAIPIRDMKDVEAMAALDAQAREELTLPTLVADAFVGIVLAVERSGERATRIETVAALSDGIANADGHAKFKLLRDAKNDLSIDVGHDSTRRPFHWPLEFPEVFGSQSQGFHVILGNPPFLGGRRLKSALGQAYPHYISNFVGKGKSSNADLCAYFFNRASSMVRMNGSIGFIATNSIAQGATHAVGLNELCSDGFNIYYAVPNYEWPGDAGVTTAVVCLFNGRWNGQAILDNSEVTGINSYLAESDPGSSTWSPEELNENKDKAFQGSNVLGAGFVLIEEQAKEILQKSPDYAEVVMPFVRGEDFNSDPQQLPRRWIINFHDWPLERSGESANARVASDFPDALEIVERLVKPKRQEAKRKPYREKWWQYAEKCTSLYRAVNGLRRVIFQSSPSKHLCFAFAPIGVVYSGPHTVIASEKVEDLGVLLSTIHTEWAWRFCSTMRNSGIRYNPSDFRKFPWPKILVPDVVSASSDVLGARAAVHEKFGCGLTTVYNNFHDEQVRSTEIENLRAAQRCLDETIAQSYGWSDLDLSLDFFETGQGKRFTVKPDTKTAIVDRLLLENKTRFEDSVDRGASSLKASNNLVSAQDQVEFLLSVSDKGPLGDVTIDSAIEKIERYLRTRRSWLSKSDILSDVGVSESQGTAAIDDLITRGTIERRGESRMELYRIAEDH
ncbi:Eco57I restriction-modification methylase domain-containing protein [Hoeflea sp.]|uniref:Eco57I restriction-modification methylase domain-containing protein n=1 Tax=Hoeflea sp. TaxID=1940281 RepID=UPI003A95C702